MDNITDVTAPKADAPTVEDRFEVETNVAPEPEKVEKPETPEKVEKPESKESKPDTETPAEPTEPKPINPRTLQRRAEKERLIRENAALAERLAQYEAKKPEKEAPKERDLSKEPDIQDYDDALEFARDQGRYDRLQEKKAADEAAKLESEEKRIAAFDERAVAYRAEKPDFDEKVTALQKSNLLTPDIKAAVLNSDMSEKLGYHLANYGSDLMLLRGLPKEALPKAIEAIENFIKQGNVAEKPRVTQAQPPITPPGSTTKTDRSVNSYSQEEIENMPLSEYNKKFGKI